MSTRRAVTVAASILAVMLSAGCSDGSDSPVTSTSATADAGHGVDPSTLAGACSLLVGPTATFVDDALASGRAVVEGVGASADDDRSAAIQNNLFKIVTNGPEELRDPAGQLVDYLDDPKAYETAGEVDPLVTGAADEIDRTCADQAG